MIKRKRKRNPLKDDKKLMRKIAEFLAKAIEKEPDGITAYLLAAELVRRDSLYCEECHSFDIEKGCDWSECYPEIYELAEDSTLDMTKESAEELAEDLGIVDYVKVFRYIIQYEKYKNSNRKDKNKPNIILSKAELSETDLSEINLFGANLPETNLSGADLSRTNLTDANLFKANLSDANLFKANLSGARLAYANLSEANLSEAYLNWSNLYKTIFTDSKITKTTSFLNAKSIDDAIGLKIINPQNSQKAKKNASNQIRKNKNKKKNS